MSSEQTQHTPGPWNWASEHDLRSASRGVLNLDTGMIRDADRSLIAASPDLLEAVKLAVAYYEQFETFGLNVDTEQLGAEERALLWTLRAAIQKATQT